MEGFWLFIIIVTAYTTGKVLKYYNDRTLARQDQWADETVEWLQNVKKMV